MEEFIILRGLDSAVDQMRGLIKVRHGGHLLDRGANVVVEDC